VTAAALSGRRVLVVGASSGIGRAVGVAAASAGARVVMAARRVDRLEDAVAETGGAAFALPCDVLEPTDCALVVERAADQLGGLDAVVYSAGVSPLRRVAESDSELWRRVVGTNLIGAALVAAAALPHLLAGRGRLVLLGSSSEGRPFPGLVAYGASKAGLRELARGLRNEHPGLWVTTVVVGPTLSELASGWDEGLAAEMFARWEKEGYLPTLSVLPVEETAAQVIHVLATAARVDEVHVMPPEHRP